ncbi:UNVERIFIED_CONTAM: Phytochrome A [Sesamum radiatum]|uniref:Phytochrome A n=1 Tax=Sesamum radiatum TaxID=300843 RepID=A0AAW2K3M9_SESRA
MDAIYSLQLILRNAFKEAEAKDSDTKEIHMKFNDLKIDGIQELKAVISEIVCLIETAFVPIVDGGLVNGWNTKNVDLIDLPVDEAIACCRLKSGEAFVNFCVIINNAVTSQDSEKMPFGFFLKSGKNVECLLSVSKKLDGMSVVKGVFYFLQLANHELQQALYVQRLSKQTAMKRSRVLAYVAKEIRNPLSKIIFT